MAAETILREQRLDGAIKRRLSRSRRIRCLSSSSRQNNRSVKMIPVRLANTDRQDAYPTFFGSL